MKLNPLFLASIFFSFSAQAQVFVKQDAKGLNNGTSWENAYNNLDSAINKTSSGQIWVAAGIYKPSLDVNTPFKVYKAFAITKKIGLYGGFKGSEKKIDERDIIKNITILSGDLGIEEYELDNTPRIVTITGNTIDSNTVVDGFTITKSYYTNGYDYQTGAVYINCYQGPGQPIIRNCTIKDNVGFFGGGIYVSNRLTTGSPLLINNLIINNIAFEGAGIYSEYTNAIIINNKIIKNRCIGGYSNLAGGGIQIMAYSSPLIDGNLIDSNYAGTKGGGISNQSNYIVTISNNIISHDSSETGGGLYLDFNTELINNEIVNNHASFRAGGLYLDYSSGSRSINNTIVNNSSEYYAGALYVNDASIDLINTIIYNNPTKYDKPISIVNFNRGDLYPRFDYCDIENGIDGFYYLGFANLSNIWRAGNITNYPEFRDTVNLNYQLSVHSPCINTGKPDTSGLRLPLKDIFGNARIINNRIDIGCFEFNEEILAIKLLDFSATLTKDHALINWEIERNDANSFELEKSIDGRIFTSLFQISALGNAQENYIYKDESLYNGHNYYRLKIMDNKGDFFYSNIVTVFYKKNNSLQIFPNPVSDQLYYSFKPLSSPSKYVCQIYSLAGRLIYQTTINSSNSAGAINVDFLSSGIYLFKISSSDEKTQSLFIKK